MLELEKNTSIEVAQHFIASIDPLAAQACQLIPARRRPGGFKGRLQRTDASYIRTGARVPPLARDTRQATDDAKAAR